MKEKETRNPLHTQFSWALGFAYGHTTSPTRGQMLNNISAGHCARRMRRYTTLATCFVVPFHTQVRCRVQ